MRRKDTPIHRLWHKRVDGQIRDAMHAHPEWFNIRSAREKETIINSLSKRIVGEIVSVGNMEMRSSGMAVECAASTADAGVRLSVPASGHPDGSLSVGVAESQPIPAGVSLAGNVSAVARDCAAHASVADGSILSATDGGSMAPSCAAPGPFNPFGE